MKKQKFSEDTITAISTPLGESAIGVIRLSGPGAVSIADTFFDFSGRGRLRTAPSHTVCRGTVHDGTDIVDQVMVTVMRSPRSYTGEDVVEISTHGSPVVLRRVLQMICSRGGRLAEPGEFTRRAYLNGKIDLVQAEAVADLIRARTDTALRVAQQQLAGALSDRISRLKDHLVECIVQIEVRLDHPDEDVGSLDRRQLMCACERIGKDLERLLETSARGRIIKDGIKAAIIGKPNAGKSSLMNALLGRDRSIVTDEPGTTRDTVDAVCEVKGIPVRIIDTAGIRAHAFSKAEHIGIKRSRKAAEAADVILAVYDASTAVGKDDRQVADICRDRKTVAILNKTDISRPSFLRTYSRLLKAPVSISALHGKGITNLCRRLHSAAVDRLPAGDATVVVTNARHEDALQRSAAAVSKAGTALKKGEPEECIAFELHEAVAALDVITGKTTDDDILDQIFTRFCIGK